MVKTTTMMDVTVRIEHGTARADWNPPWYIVQYKAPIDGARWETQRLGVYYGPPRVWLTKAQALVGAWKLKKATTYFVRVTAFGYDGVRSGFSCMKCSRPVATKHTVCERCVELYAADQEGDH